MEDVFGAVTWSYRWERTGAGPAEGGSCLPDPVVYCEQKSIAAEKSLSRDRNRVRHAA